MKSLSLIEHLKPVHPQDASEWNEIVRDFKQEYAKREPELFWYLASGMDWKALVHFNEKDTTQTYRTPTVDLFLFTDYIIMEAHNYVTHESIPYFYKELDQGPVLLHQDDKTQITMEQAIPLWYFSPEDIEDLKKTHNPEIHATPSRVYDNLAKLYCHFCYAHISIRSNYFGDEYFPVLLSPLENTLVKDRIILPNNLRFRYLCSVCDGCSKGGAHRCSAHHYMEFLDVMHPDERYWICDHIKRRIPKEEFSQNFTHLRDLWNWGRYGIHHLGGDSVELSRLYRLRPEPLERRPCCNDK